MSYKLIIFPTPLDARCEMRHDITGVVIIGKPDTHHTGRKGQSFEFSSDTPNENGCRLIITAKGKVALFQRGILYLNDGILQYPWDVDQTAAFSADDFVLEDEKVCPEIPPIPPVPPVIDKPTNSAEFKEWFFKQVEGKPFGEPTLRALEPALISVGSALTPANANGEKTKIQDPFTKIWIRVGFGEGHWVWIPQS